MHLPALYQCRHQRVVRDNVRGQARGLHVPHHRQHGVGRAPVLPVPLDEDVESVHPWHHPRLHHLAQQALRLVHGAVGHHGVEPHVIRRAVQGRPALVHLIPQLQREVQGLLPRPSARIAAVLAQRADELRVRGQPWVHAPLLHLVQHIQGELDLAALDSRPNEGAHHRPAEHHPLPAQVNVHTPRIHEPVLLAELFDQPLVGCLLRKLAALPQLVEDLQRPRHAASGHGIPQVPPEPLGIASAPLTPPPRHGGFARRVTHGSRKAVVGLRGRQGHAGVCPSNNTAT
mmetsp:Transcript_30956/g.98829  ORF Transcript_30956/g.98829 Transcript_30956/m.98829 type:complete len:287 (+) Transcript_30956:1169-2029(+)